MKIGRNDPCPCGSGKKYKKCCGNKKVVDLSETIVQEELDQWYFRFNDYIAEYYPYLISREAPSSELDHFKKHMELMSKTTFEKNKQGQSIMQEYTNRVIKDIVRPITRESLEEWPNAIPGLFMIFDRTSDHSVKVQQELTGEEYEVRKSTISHAVDSNENYYLGVLMKWGREYQFIPSALSMIPEIFYELSSVIEEDYEKTDTHQSIVEFFGSNFNYYVDVMFNFEVSERSPEEGWDGSDKEKEVLRLLDHHLDTNAKRAEGYPYLTALWMYYCDYYSPTIRKPEVFAATLEYFYMDSPYFDLRIGSVTQKEIAKKYGISPNSISRRWEELEDTFFEMVNEFGGKEDPEQTAYPIPTFPSWEVMAERASYEMNVLISRQDFSSGQELQPFIEANQNKPFVAETAEEKAQLLAYDAYATNSLKEREELIEQALQLDPKSIDARVLKASLEPENIQKLIILLSACNDALRNTNLDLNKGEAWHNVFARPFLRAQELLASVYVENREYKEAINHYESLLEYNINDNQGIREKVFPLYIETGNIEKARHLLVRYDGDETWPSYSEVLLSLEMGESSGVINVEMSEAQSANPFVIPYLLGEKTWTELPKTYRSGTEEEAIVYAYRNGHVWEPYHAILSDYM